MICFIQHPSHEGETLYILRASGRSMIDAGIDDGDLVVIRKTEEAEKGSIIVALDEFGQNTLKKYGGYDPETGSYLLEYMNENRFHRTRQMMTQSGSVCRVFEK